MLLVSSVYRGAMDAFNIQISNKLSFPLWAVDPQTGYKTEHVWEPTCAPAP
jgi:hypothetical protein